MVLIIDYRTTNAASSPTGIPPSPHSSLTTIPLTLSTLHSIVSFINAALTGGLAFHTVVVKSAFRTDIIHAYPPSADLVFSLMVGYQVYDCVAIWYGGKPPAGMWLHHALVILGSGAMIVVRVAAFYPLAFSITELTGLSFNVHVWMKPMGWDKRYPQWFTFNMIIGVVSFWTLRFFLGPAVVWYAYTRGQLFALYQLDNMLVPILTTINVVVLSLLNVLWTLKLTQYLVNHLRHGPKARQD